MYSKFSSRRPIGRFIGMSLAAVAAIASLSSASAQTKVGVISAQRAVLQTAEIKKAQAALEAKFRPRQEQGQRLQGEIQALQQQLQNKNLTQAGELEVTAQGKRKQTELTRLNEDLQAEVDRERNEILGKTGQRMQDIVKKLAEEKGLDVVIDMTNTVFFKPALDLTNDAVAAYDKAYPAN